MSGPGGVAGSPRPSVSKRVIGLTQASDLHPSLASFLGDFKGLLPTGFLATINQANVQTITAESTSPALLSYQVQATDFVLFLDATNAPLTVYLPKLNGSATILLIKVLNATNPITIVPFYGSPDTIIPSSPINLTTTDSGALLFSNATSWAYFLSEPASVLTGDVVGPSSSVDNSIPVYDGVTGKLIKDFGKVTMDSAGNIVPITSDASSLGSNIQEWLYLYAQVITGLTSLLLQSNNGNLSLASTGGDVLVIPGVNERHYDSNGTEIFNLSRAAGKSFATVLGIPIIFFGTASPPSMSAGQVQIYKGATANQLFYIGEDNVTRLLTFPVDSSGVFQAILDMGSHKIQNVTDPSSAQDAATKHYVDNHTFSDSGFVTLSGGLATINSSKIKAGLGTTQGIVLTPCDLNTLGTVRLDPSTISAGVSAGINSTGALDTGIIFWGIY